MPESYSKIIMNMYFLILIHRVGLAQSVACPPLAR